MQISESQRDEFKRMRRAARIKVFELVFAKLIDSDSNTIDGYIDSPLYDEYIKRVYDIVQDNFDLLSDRIRKEASRDNKNNRLYKVDLAIMLVAAAELEFCDDIGKEISINEAVDIAKQYSTKDSFRFVNGVLAGIVRQLDI